MKLSDIYDAKRRLEAAVHLTALDFSQTFSAVAGRNVFIKLENLQKTGSFKVRGAFNATKKLVESGQTSPVIASSAGNHAQGVAFAAHELGLQSTIVMPQSTPIAKVLATENYGATVELFGEFYDDAYSHAMKLVERSGGRFIHPFDDDDVIAGQGTIGLEILEQNSDIDTIVVPIGGGGLIAGVALAVKNLNPKIKVIGVQAERANAMELSFHKGQRVGLDNIFTIADGIAVKNPGQKTFAMIKKYVDEVVTVSDDEIAATIIQLIERTKLVVEPAGAASLAAILHGKIKGGKNLAAILSGGNIDVGFMSKIIERGLVSRGRQLRFSVILADKPGSLEKFARVMGAEGANIVSVQYDRISAELRLNETILHIGCEVGSFEHGQKVLGELRKAGYEIID